MLDKTKNYKIDVSALNTAERTALQEELFLLGYKWYESGQKVSELNADVLFLSPDMDITCGNKKDLSRYDYPILTVPDIMPQPIPEERTLRDWFAGLAMVQIMQTHDDGEVAGWSYHFADMMLKERNK